MTLTVTIRGETRSDLTNALQEALKKVEDGCISGSDTNDTGEYSFARSGEPVDHYRIKRKGRTLAKQYGSRDEASEYLRKGDTIVMCDYNGYELESEILSTKTQNS